VRQIFIDNQTTGIDVELGHRLIELVAVEVVDGKITGNYFHTYINQEKDIDEGAVALHGISKEFLQDKPFFNEIVSDFYAFIHGADEILAHHSSFDVDFFNNELKYLKESFLPIDEEFNVVDTLELSRKMLPGRKQDLDSLCEYFKLDIENNESYKELEGAFLDARILADIYLCMYKVERC